MKMTFFYFITVLTYYSANLNAGMMDDIIDDVKHNEDLYKNIEVRIEYRYKVFPKGEEVIPEAIEAQTSFYRYVLQDDLIYFKLDKDETTIDHKKTHAGTLRGFDGSTTRVFEQETIGNLIEGRAEDTRLTAQKPHVLLFRRPPALVRCPLWMYLQGGDALKTQPNFKTKNVRVKFEGEEIVNGLRCFKLRIILWIDEWKGPLDENECQFVWLSPDRNYLPVKMELHTHKGNFIEQIGRIDDLREISPGIWFPFRATLDCYDVYHYNLSKIVRIGNKDEIFVKKAELNPNYDISLFRNINFPNGTTVYVIKDGEIVRSYIEGIANPESYKRNHWFAAAMIAFVFTVFTSITIIKLKRRRRRIRSVRQVA